METTDDAAIAPAQLPQEIELRSPGAWLSSIKCPTFVFEGFRGNISSLQTMAKRSNNALCHFLAINGGDHFGILAPINRMLADKILRDDGEKSNLIVIAEEANKAFAR